jgi:hypothetical protein
MSNFIYFRYKAKRNINWLNVGYEEPIKPIGIMTADGTLLNGTIKNHKSSKQGNYTRHRIKITSMAEIRNSIKGMRMGTAYGPFKLLFEERDGKRVCSSPFLLVTDK